MSAKKVDHRLDGLHTQRAMAKEEYVRELFGQNKETPTDQVWALVKKRFGKGLTPLRINALRKEFGVSYGPRGALRVVSDRNPVTPEVTPSMPVQVQTVPSKGWGAAAPTQPPNPITNMEMNQDKDVVLEKVMGHIASIVQALQSGNTEMLLRKAK